MAFIKGKSGNPKGRPRKTLEEKLQKEQFKELLKEFTFSALESIIEIANDGSNKDRFNACKYIIDKSYGTDKALLIEETEDEPITIKIIPKYRVNEED